MKFLRPRLELSHIAFVLLFSSTLFLSGNLLNFDKFSRWFQVGNHLDLAGIAALLTTGLCLSVVVFALLLHPFIAKPVAAVFAAVSTTCVYFIAKYDVAIDRSMFMNALNTDPSEVHSLVSIHMLPYALGLGGLYAVLIFGTRIRFGPRYFLRSIRLIGVMLIISVSLVYAQFNGISRAVNISQKYVVHSMVPINIVQSLGSAAQHGLQPYFRPLAQQNDVSGVLAQQEDLVVVLAVGETSRQKSFGLYGYTGNETTPRLSSIDDLHVLNGKARIGSTLYALREILVKDGVPLTLLADRAGVKTACYVNYTLYKNCAVPGEVQVRDCGGPGGKCYDEDVIPLLRNHLADYQAGAGQSLVVLHLGGGSHGPSYHERYPEQFQAFQPLCQDADVLNQCTQEELVNAYDNSILYVDHVLNEAIATLEQSGHPYVFVFVSDHGESLNENGRIFHGMPPGIPLPPEQAQVPLLVKSSMPIRIDEREEYSQRDLFDTILGLLAVHSPAAEPQRGFIRQDASVP